MQGVEAKYSQKIYSQLVGWNSESFSIPLWALQTDEHEGEGAWGKTFLREDTGLVAYTDLYKITEYAGFNPRSVDDIQKYMQKEAARGKSKKKKGRRNKQTAIQYASPQDALLAYLGAQFPGADAGMSLDVVNNALQKQNNEVGPALNDLLEIAQANITLSKTQKGANRRRSQPEQEPEPNAKTPPVKNRKAKRY